MGWFDFLRPKGEAPSPPPATQDEAGDRVARDLVEALDFISNYTIGVPTWFDRHLADIRNWWKFRKKDPQ